MAHMTPESCGHEMRNGACNMETGHRGRHTTQAWECDGCGKRRRGSPASTHPEAGRYCFMCVQVPDPGDLRDYGYGGW